MGTPRGKPAATRAALGARELVPFEPRWTDALISMWRESFEEGVGIRDPHPLSEQRQYFQNDILPSYELLPVATHLSG